MLRRLRRRLARPDLADVRDRIRTIPADAHRLPFGDGTFDAAVMVTVLPELADKAAALREVRRVLRDGGHLADTESVIDPNFMRYGRVRALGAEAGFDVAPRSGHWASYTACMYRHDL
eukprot:TRINITY_DN9371_c0_g1_i2.p2 TRINITY_DN9371_c0_g1~~TRINITY_DN9371_c0_g1_i2.p2  ORF type:complete len:118 (+),score=24.27 TRINITY_DN9371_c0_g1_i2:568-921(+)